MLSKLKICSLHLVLVCLVGSYKQTDKYEQYNSEDVQIWASEGVAVGRKLHQAVGDNCSNDLPDDAFFSCDEYAANGLCDALEHIYCQSSCDKCCTDVLFPGTLSCNDIVESNNCNTEVIRGVYCNLSCGNCPGTISDSTITDVVQAPRSPPQPTPPPFSPIQPPPPPAPTTPPPPILTPDFPRSPLITEPTSPALVLLPEVEDDLPFGIGTVLQVGWLSFLSDEIQSTDFISPIVDSEEQILLDDSPEIEPDVEIFSQIISTENDISPQPEITNEPQSEIIPQTFLEDVNISPQMDITKEPWLDIVSQIPQIQQEFVDDSPQIELENEPQLEIFSQIPQLIEEEVNISPAIEMSSDKAAENEVLEALNPLPESELQQSSQIMANNQFDEIPTPDFCTDVPPEGVSTCSELKASGSCNLDFMVRGGFCDFSCGRCSQPIISDACFDIIPEGGFSCTQRAQFGACKKAWIIQGDYCQQTCGYCFSPNDSCGARETNIQGDILVLDVNSMSSPATPQIVSNFTDCCNECKETFGCNAWVFCSNKNGCGSGCDDYIAKLGGADGGFGEYGGCSGSKWPPYLCSLKNITDVNNLQEEGAEDGWISGIRVI